MATLGIGIGATTAIFSVVHAVLLAPMPYAHADRIARVVMHAPAAESPTGRPIRASLPVTAAEIDALRARARTLSHVGSAGRALRTLRGHDNAAGMQGARVSATVLAMVDARPLLGRLFTPDDEAPGAPPVVLLREDTWRRFFGARPEILGAIVSMDSVLGPRVDYHYTVVGVLPDTFAYPDTRTPFWIPFQAPAPGARAGGPLVARLADGASVEAATGELTAILREVRPAARDTRYELVADREELAAPVRPALLAIFVAVGMLLLIACVNVASLWLARSAARQRELAVRVALGASRGRLFRQQLTESGILALAGGAIGVAVAVGALELLRTLTPALSRFDLPGGPPLPRLDEVGIDFPVLLFALGTTLTTGIVFGLAPAWNARAAEPLHALKGGAPSSARVSRWSVLRAREGLVVLQVASAALLLVGGTLLGRTFLQMARVDPGFAAGRVVTFQVSLPAAGWSNARLLAFAEQMTARVRAIAGVEAAAYGNQLPMVALSDTAGGLWTTPDARRAPAPGGPDARFVSPDYLDVLRIPVIAGRGFDAAGQDARPRSLLVNQALADRMFEGASPLGETVFIGRDVTPWEIVGVVGNVRQFALDREAEPQFFADLRQWSGTGPLFPLGAYYAVRTTGDVAPMLERVREIARTLEPQAALYNAASMDQVVASTLTRPRLYAVLLALFAAVGLALALVGVYGVVAYAVAARTREVGIRVALGATPRDAVSLVLVRFLTLATAGIVAGLAGAAGLARFVEHLLFGVSARDPFTYATVFAAFLVVATAAALVPARAAARVDPVIAIRVE